VKEMSGGIHVLVLVSKQISHSLIFGLSCGTNEASTKNDLIIDSPVS